MGADGSKRCVYDGCSDIALAFTVRCWEHTEEKDRYSATITDKIERGDDLSFAHLAKVSLKGVRATSANLAGANLSQADLRDSYLFDANLEGANLVGAELSGADLTHCTLKGADLTQAKIRNARLWNANLTAATLSEASLEGSDLWNANLHNAKLWHANLTAVRSLDRRSFTAPGSRGWTAKINEDGLLSAQEAYRDLKSFFLAGGKYDDAGWASFKEKTIERAHLKKKADLRYFPSLIMGLLCGYGEKPVRIIVSAIAAILLYAGLYCSLDAVQASGDPLYTLRWSDYIYYSTITFTTTGYGDFLPRAATSYRLLAASEAFAGVFITGLFVFTLARTYSAR